MAGFAQSGSRHCESQRAAKIEKYDGFILDQSGTIGPAGFDLASNRKFQ
jgi:hypothetical protein